MTYNHFKNSVEKKFIPFGITINIVGFFFLAKVISISLFGISISLTGIIFCIVENLKLTKRIYS